MPYKTMSARSLLASASIDSLLISRAWTSAFVEGPSRRVRFEPFQWLAAPFSIRTGGRNGRRGRRALSYKTMYIRSLSTNAFVDLVLASWAFTLGLSKARPGRVRMETFQWFAACFRASGNCQAGPP